MIEFKLHCLYKWKFYRWPLLNVFLPFVAMWKLTVLTRNAVGTRAESRSWHFLAVSTESVVKYWLSKNWFLKYSGCKRNIFTNDFCSKIFLKSLHHDWIFSEIALHRHFIIGFYFTNCLTFSMVDFTEKKHSRIGIPHNCSFRAPKSFFCIV